MRMLSSILNDAAQAWHEAPTWLSLTLRLNELTASRAQLPALLDEAADAVLATCRAREVAFYARADEEPGRTSRGRCLVRLGRACASRASEVPNDRLQRRMRAVALGALSHAGVLVRRARRRAPDDTADVALVALALGGPQPHTIVVIGALGSLADDAATTLSRAAPALGTLANAAHLAGQVERADRRHAQLQAVFSHSSEAILTVDRSFHLVEANPAFSSLLQCDASASLGRHCSDVLMCRDERGRLLCRTDDCPLAQAFAVTNAAPYREVMWQTTAGKGKEVSASFAVVPSPDGLRGVIIARDMSPLNAANRMRANFISMVSHELRTPLNSINGFLEIVLEGHVGELNVRQEEFLNYAQTSTHQLMTLVEDILFISKADTGQFKLRFASVDLYELVAQVAKNFQATAQRAQVELHVSLPADLPTIYADELRVQQVLSNLVNNAIKFTPPHGCVTISTGTENDTVRVDVSDTGEGVPLEDQERIFERFYQSESTARSIAGGYGLGLAIAKLIVEQHRGRIWVQARPGQGSTFSFTIPLQPEARPAQE
jgi:signal transduction histidine kinase